MKSQRLRLLVPEKRLPAQFVGAAQKDAADLLASYGVPDGAYLFVIGEVGLSELPGIAQCFFAAAQQLTANTLYRVVDTVATGVIGALDFFLLPPMEPSLLDRAY